ncbi:hypothetical protein Bca4012_065602 [Brassica carinata]
MNCLSHMLNSAAANGEFAYHDTCAPTGLTHLCFVDDLLIFSDGTLSSVQGILKVLHSFKELSGLAISISKTSFFSAGVSDQELSAISASTGLSHGSLRVRYLGVLLCTKKISIANCDPLITQIKLKILEWSFPVIRWQTGPNKHCCLWYH